MPTDGFTFAVFFSTVGLGEVVLGTGSGISSHLVRRLASGLVMEVRTARKAIKEECCGEGFQPTPTGRDA